MAKDQFASEGAGIAVRQDGDDFLVTGKRHPFESLRSWFQALYETLLGSSQGPRMGSFIALYGIDNSRKLIAEALQPA